MAVSNTLIPLPTPPAVLASGVLMGPLLAALIGGVANCIGASVDYLVGTKIPEADKHMERYKKIQPMLDKFKQNAFFAIVIAGFTPFVFDPIRLAAGYVRYDIKKYWMAVFLGRAPRFYILAWIGKDAWNVLREALV
jgi:membrane protein YqaA with SNARE-associated domain